VPGQDVVSFESALALGTEEWAEFLAHERPVDGLVPPPLPDEGLQRAWVGSSGVDALLEAGRFTALAVEALSERGASPDDVGRVLDFGCGWGRIYRCFLRHCRPGSLVGVDIDEGCVALCRKAMPYGSFELCDPMPPLAFADEAFDAVTAYSVFSHLAEEPFRRWLREFARVLRPGGFVFFTTLKEAHVDAWKHRRREAAHGAALKAVGFTPRSWRKRASSGHVLFVPTGGGGTLESPTFYGETIVPRAYMEREAEGLGFELMRYSDDGELPQAFVTLVKADGDRTSVTVDA
jgi:SAM-dependent methyltransferase